MTSGTLLFICRRHMWFPLILHSQVHSGTVRRLKRDVLRLAAARIQPEKQSLFRLELQFSAHGRYIAAFDPASPGNGGIDLRFVAGKNGQPGVRGRLGTGEFVEFAMKSASPLVRSWRRPSGLQQSVRAPAPKAGPTRQLTASLSRLFVQSSRTAASPFP